MSFAAKVAVLCLYLTIAMTLISAAVLTVLILMVGMIIYGAVAKTSTKSRF